MVALLDGNLVSNHRKAVEILRTLRQDATLTEEPVKFLGTVLGEGANEVIDYFTPKDIQEEPAIDKSLPSIMLTSFVGSKGLSAGHVFIIGLNNGAMPKDPYKILDIEISQFVVALTRTRKQCHLIANSWLASAKQGEKWLPKFSRSEFIAWIPTKLVDSRGEFKASNFK